MKEKFLKCIFFIAAVFSGFMALGWSFFELTVRGRSNQASQTGRNRRKWFQLSHIKANHPRNGYEKEYEEGKAWCQQQKMQDCYLESVDGLELHARYLPAKDARRFVVLCHGYKGNAFSDFAYMARFLHENHCNLLFIDERCCGQSEGKFITFGAMEQYDVQKWAEYVAKRNHKSLPVYLYGESMGAASVLMASGQNLPREVKGIIADCGFRSMRGQMQDMAKNWFHLNWIELLMFRLNLFCTFLAGFRMKDADTTEALRKNKRPVLFFHGEMDTYVDVSNSKYNYTICQAPKELVIVPGARHISSPYVAPELYRSKVLSFFHQYDK